MQILPAPKSSPADREWLGWVAPPELELARHLLFIKGKDAAKHLVLRD